MQEEFNLSLDVSDADLKYRLHDSKIGFEREGLRISDIGISQSKHPKELGSALFNEFITTDFSESQLELVTPPHKDKIKALYFLEDIHHYAYHKIGSEIIWPFSIPPNFHGDEMIPIADYGSSDLGRFKKLYRSGLAHRYGRIMQAISGIHYNFSLGKNFWQSDSTPQNDDGLKHLRSRTYLKIIRNLKRINWMLLYLFGASPILSRNLVPPDAKNFCKLNRDAFYLPYATSLRMSRFGYSNENRDMLNVSLNSLESYIRDITEATITPSNHYNSSESSFFENKVQINNSILQIDDEYYAIARPKSNNTAYKRSTKNLQKGGIDFIEIRSIDINPFSSIGIDEESVLLIELLTLYCLFAGNQGISDKEQLEINQNDSTIAENGRAVNQHLFRNGNRISVASWGLELLDEMIPIAEFLDGDGASYISCISSAREKFLNPDSTLSARVIEETVSKNISFEELGNHLGELHKNQYIKRPKESNKNWALLERQAKESIQKLKFEELKKRSSLDEIIYNYFHE